jgi:hypothetical protein
VGQLPLSTCKLLPMKSSCPHMHRSPYTEMHPLTSVCRHRPSVSTHLCVNPLSFLPASYPRENDSPSHFPWCAGGWDWRALILLSHFQERHLTLTLFPGQTFTQAQKHHQDRKKMAPNCEQHCHTTLPSMYQEFITPGVKQ